MRDILLVSMVIVCALIAIRRPVFGLLAFVCFGLINPQSYTWGFGRTFPLAQLTALGTIVGFILSPESKRFPWQRETFLLIVLWILFCISTFFAVFPDRGLPSDKALDAWKQISKIFLMVILSLSIINSRERLHWLMRVIALSLGFMGFKGGMFAILTGGTYMVWGPEGSFLYANNAIGLALAMNIPFLFYLIKMEPYPWLRKIMWIMLVLSYPAIICTFSRGAWVAMAAVTGLLLLKMRYKFALILGGGVLALAIIPLFGMLLSSNLLPDRVVSRFHDLVNYEEEVSAQSRFWNWELCKRVGLANPLTGKGFSFYNQAMYAEYLPEFQEYFGYEQVWSCHSMWLTILAEHGILPFILWILILVSCFLSLRRLVRVGHIIPSVSWIGQYGHMIQIGLIAYAICGTFLDVAYFDLFYQLLAVIVIAKEEMRKELEESVLYSLDGKMAEQYNS